VHSASRSWQRTSYSSTLTSTRGADLWSQRDRIGRVIRNTYPVAAFQRNVAVRCFD
jgi:hypothetical protein